MTDDTNEERNTNSAVVSVPPLNAEALEWRPHDSLCEITHTGFGPYLVERLSDEAYRAWLPDDTGNARIMVEGLRTRSEAVSHCQRDIDGRRAVALVVECGPYLYPNETPSQRIVRERRDTERLLLQLADVKAKRSAAPELLDGLKELVEAYEGWDRFKERALKVIAKAEGRS